MTDFMLKWRDPIQSDLTRSWTPQLNHAIPFLNACRSVIPLFGQWSATAPQQWDWSSLAHERLSARRCLIVELSILISISMRLRA